MKRLITPQNQMKQLFVLFLTCVWAPCLGQEKAILIRDVDSLVNSYLVNKDLPSAAVGIVHGQEIVYQKRIVRGSHEIGETDQSIYNIASVAKPFVATAILMLEEEGKINLEAPINKYLPDIELNSKFTGSITIEHLLTHTSGLPSTSTATDYEYINVDTTDNALQNHINSLSKLKLKFKPGKKYSYSNVGYEILGQIIAAVSGLSFDEFMETRIFQPLQLTRTSYLLSNFQAQEIAQPHNAHPNRVTERFPYNRAFSPSGNLFTSIEDINRWMLFNLNKGRLGNFEPLPPEKFALLTTPRVPTEEDGSVGLSWFVDKNLIFHDGLDLGYTALMVFFEKQRIGITVLINHQEGNCNELLNLIVKSIKY